MKMNAYEQKLADRKGRLEARAAKLKAEGNAKYNQAHKMAEAIPFGQPILIGHHSESHDRNYRGRIHSKFGQAFAAMQEAAEVAARAASIGTGGISSDDPEAIVKLRAELAEDEARQNDMKAANAAWRKAGNKAGRQPDGSWVDQPHPPYQLSNNSQNMARIRGRIAQLERSASRETKEQLHNSGVRVVENAEANRVQLFFPGKPSDEIRTMLKSHGFRWSPMEGAWQRHLNNSGIYAARHAVEAIAKAQGA